MGAPPLPHELPEEAIEVERPVRRLQLAAVLLVVAAVVGVLGAVAAWSAQDGIGGLGALLEEPRADVMGVVKDADGDPVVGATVTAVDEGMSATTGVDGYYFLEGVPTGRVELRMEAQGHVTVVRRVTLERGTYVVDLVTRVGSGSEEVPSHPAPSAGDSTRGAFVVVLAMAVGAVAAVAGAFGAWTRNYYTLALTGALLGLFTWGWWLGTVLAAVAVALVAPLRREFRGAARERKHLWDVEPPASPRARSRAPAGVPRPADAPAPSSPSPPQPPQRPETSPRQGAPAPPECAPPADVPALPEEPTRPPAGKPPLGGMRIG